MRTTVKIVICLAIVLSAASCSSDSGSDEGSAPKRTTTSTTEPAATTTTEDLLADLPDPDSYEAAIVANASSGANSATLTPEEAACVAPKWISVAQPERLEAKGITPAALQQGIDVAFVQLGMNEDEGNALADAVDECGVDFKGLYTRASTFEALTPETQTCVEGALTDEFVRRLLVVSMTIGGDKIQTDPALVEQLTALFTACPALLAEN